jgi:hypothetical protein
MACMFGREILILFLFMSFLLLLLSTLYCYQMRSYGEKKEIGIVVSYRYRWHGERFFLIVLSLFERDGIDTILR